MKRTYEEVANEVNGITDGLNKPVDQGIKKSVIALRLWDFPTDGSCEGHLDRSLPYPWVDIYAPELPEKAWIKANESERKRLKLLLNDFYKTAPYHYRFDFEAIGIFGGFRLRSSGSKNHKQPNAELLKKYREDFDSLADFLVNKSQSFRTRLSKI